MKGQRSKWNPAKPTSCQKASAAHLCRRFLSLCSLFLLGAPCAAAAAGRALDQLNLNVRLHWLLGGQVGSPSRHGHLLLLGGPFAQRGPLHRRRHFVLRLGAGDRRWRGRGWKDLHAGKAGCWHSRCGGGGGCSCWCAGWQHGCCLGTLSLPLWKVSGWRGLGTFGFLFFLLQPGSWGWQWWWGRCRGDRAGLEQGGWGAGGAGTHQLWSGWSDDLHAAAPAGQNVCLCGGGFDATSSHARHLTLLGLPELLKLGAGRGHGHVAGPVHCSACRLCFGCWGGATGRGWVWRCGRGPLHRHSFSGGRRWVTLLLALLPAGLFPGQCEPLRLFAFGTLHHLFLVARRGFRWGILGAGGLHPVWGSSLHFGGKLFVLADGLLRQCLAAVLTAQLVVVFGGEGCGCLAVCGPQALLLARRGARLWHTGWRRSGGWWCRCEGGWRTASSGRGVDCRVADGDSGGRHGVHVRQRWTLHGHITLPTAWGSDAGGQKLCFRFSAGGGEWCLCCGTSLGSTALSSTCCCWCWWGKPPGWFWVTSLLHKLYNLGGRRLQPWVIHSFQFPGIEGNFSGATVLGLQWSFCDAAHVLGIERDLCDIAVLGFEGRFADIAVLCVGQHFGDSAVLWSRRSLRLETGAFDVLFCFKGQSADIAVLCVSRHFGDSAVLWSRRCLRLETGAFDVLFRWLHSSDGLGRGVHGQGCRLCILLAGSWVSGRFGQRLLPWSCVAWFLHWQLLGLIRGWCCLHCLRVWKIRKLR